MRINWEIGTDIYTPVYIKETTNKDLLYSRELYSTLHNDLYGKNNLKKSWVHEELIHLAVQ